jgi:hypothetical protein
MRIEELFNNPKMKTRFLKWAWLISLGMLVLGYLFMVYYWDA